jgi:hypothetical protein
LEKDWKKFKVIEKENKNHNGWELKTLKQLHIQPSHATTITSTPLH